MNKTKVGIQRAGWVGKFSVGFVHKDALAVKGGNHEISPYYVILVIGIINIAPYQVGLFLEKEICLGNLFLYILPELPGLLVDGKLFDKQ